MQSYELIQQRPWTEHELHSEGFTYFERKKELVMAGRLPATRAPLPIHYTLETVIAEAGDVLCFNPGSEVKTRLSDYEHWSNKPDIFRQTYHKWDDPDWKPTPPQLHLMRHGCQPYYKFAGVWAQMLKHPAYIQSLESPKPALIPAGVWLAIGTMGEPWHMQDATFRSRYLVPDTTTEAAPATATAAASGRKSWFVRR